MNVFQQVAGRMRAEQFLREKAASARTAAMDVIQNSLLGQVEDLDLLKTASAYCPQDPVGMYVKLGGQLKTAEPPPPPGVSSKEWDKVLSAGGSTTKVAISLGKIDQVVRRAGRVAPATLSRFEDSVQRMARATTKPAAQEKLRRVADRVYSALEGIDARNTLSKQRG